MSELLKRIRSGVLEYGAPVVNKIGQEFDTFKSFMTDDQAMPTAGKGLGQMMESFVNQNPVAGGFAKGVGQGFSSVMSAADRFGNPSAIQQAAYGVHQGRPDQALRVLGMATPGYNKLLEDHGVIGKPTEAREVTDSMGLTTRGSGSVGDFAKSSMFDMATDPTNFFEAGALAKAPSYLSRLGKATETVSDAPLPRMMGNWDDGYKPTRSAIWNLIEMGQGSRLGRPENQADVQNLRSIVFGGEGQFPSTGTNQRINEAEAAFNAKLAPPDPGPQRKPRQSELDAIRAFANKTPQGPDIADLSNLPQPPSSPMRVAPSPDPVNQNPHEQFRRLLFDQHGREVLGSQLDNPINAQQGQTIQEMRDRFAGFDKTPDQREVNFLRANMGNQKGNRNAMDAAQAAALPMDQGVKYDDTIDFHGNFNIFVPTKRETSRILNPEYGANDSKIRALYDNMSIEHQKKFSALLSQMGDMRAMADEIPDGSKVLGAGMEAMALLAPDGHVIRLNPHSMAFTGNNNKGMKIPQYRPTMPEMLQPYRRAVYDTFSAEHLPLALTDNELDESLNRINFDHDTYEEIFDNSARLQRDLISEAGGKGFFAGDDHGGNIGYDMNGRPIAIDPGTFFADDPYNAVKSGATSNSAGNFVKGSTPEELRRSISDLAALGASGSFGSPIDNPRSRAMKDVFNEITPQLQDVPFFRMRKDLMDKGLLSVMQQPGGSVGSGGNGFDPLIRAMADFPMAKFGVGPEGLTTRVVGGSDQPLDDVSNLTLGKLMGQAVSGGPVPHGSYFPELGVGANTQFPWRMKDGKAVPDPKVPLTTRHERVHGMIERAANANMSDQLPNFLMRSAGRALEKDSSFYDLLTEMAAHGGAMRNTPDSIKSIAKFFLKPEARKAYLQQFADSPGSYYTYKYGPAAVGAGAAGAAAGLYGLTGDDR
jgi:hypothetical protein